MIRQQFGQQVHREVIGELLQASFTEALTQKQLSPAGSPRIEPQTVGEGQDLTYVATFEVFPEVALRPVESLQIERITADVSESDIDAMVERLRKQQMKYTAVTRPAASGDKVTVDFEGSIDGVPFAGGKGQNTAIVIGEGRMLAQLEQGLIGAAAGETKQIGVDFPADYRATRACRQAREFQSRSEERRGSVAPRARRGVLQIVCRDRGRPAEAARGGGGQYAPRARPDAAQSQ